MFDSSSTLSSDESSSGNELSNQCKVASDSNPSSSLDTSTSAISRQCYLIESTSDIEGVELLSTDLECWNSSPSSLSISFISSFSMVCTTTSEYSAPPRHTYFELLDYSSADVNQPQPTDDIFIPTETPNN